jgi:hypothetical protein
MVTGRRVVGIASAFLASIAMHPAAQDPPQAASAKPAPLRRTADGQPDISGFWKGKFGTGEDVITDIENGMVNEPRFPVPGAPPREPPKKPNAIVDPPVPYLPWAKAVRDDNASHVYNPTRPEQLDALTRCFQMGVPRQNFFGGFKILQTPKAILAVYANNGYFNTRTIRIDGRPHPDQRIKLWMGDSVGRWDRNTLVVDVQNLNEHAWYDLVGNFHSGDAKLKERWTVVDSATIAYEVTTVDPTVFSRPWTMKTVYVRDPDAEEQWEAACYEGERGVKIILGYDPKQTEP